MANGKHFKSQKRRLHNQSVLLPYCFLLFDVFFEIRNSDFVLAVLFSAAFLVFLSAAARAGIVAPEFFGRGRQRGALDPALF